MAFPFSFFSPSALPNLQSENFFFNFPDRSHSLSMPFSQPTMPLPQLFPPHITDCFHPISRYLLQHFSIRPTPFLYFRSNFRIAVLEFAGLSVLAQSTAHFTLFLSILNPLTAPFPSPSPSSTTISNPSYLFSFPDHFHSLSMMFFFQTRCLVSRSTLHSTLQMFPFCCSQISPTAF